MRKTGEDTRFKMEDGKIQVEKEKIKDSRFWIKDSEKVNTHFKSGEYDNNKH